MLKVYFGDDIYHSVDFQAGNDFAPEYDQQVYV